QEFAEKVDRTDLLTRLGLDPSRKTVLVVGGSQGAKNLNLAVVQTVQKQSPWQFIHITGDRWYQTIRGMYGPSDRVVVLPYSHEIYALLKVVDLVVCRSGASTLSELIYCRLPAILVPFPHAAANHQFYNAKILEQKGCALLVTDNTDLKEQLEQAFKKLEMPDISHNLSAMHRAYRQLDIPNPIFAAKEIAQRLCNL
ncbi:MAG: UDP-N-acetylglucosamine--N-acetylmuramyl-(pentapeptide) pyrophosphoryl-undecaprenol N-acetylglucosamine transferase, partial [Elusimicrobiaceae bacterium]|nr:UDP-N-acetylglucosamine--N-acetylmuramyl-(pentapeptide) pyrophosphoryl-undecaprenol N-acetylglucosamine transferase [Elusimicrobiaceae bacterium]